MAMSTSEFLFVNKPSDSLICPICQDIYQDPVITHRCHHSYCSFCIHQSIEREPCCPLCRCRLSDQDLHPNLALASLISELPVYCKHKSAGCQAVVRLDSLNFHLKNCSFAPNLCIHNQFGCSFIGSENELNEHLQSCPFEMIKGFIQFTQDKISKLENQIHEQQLQIDELKSGHVFIENNHKAENLNEAENDTRNSASSSQTIEEIETSFPYDQITCQYTLNDNTSGITSLAYSNHLLFSGSHDGTTKIFDTQAETLIWENKAHSTSVWAVAAFQDDQRFFSAGSDGLIKAWDWTDSNTQTAHELDQHEGKVYALLCRFGKLFSGSSDKTIKIWDPRTLQWNATLEGHTDNINSLIPLRNGRIISASSDKTIKIWDVAAQTCIHTIQAEDSEILDCAVSQDNKFLYASTYDANIHVYNLEDYTLETTLQGHNWEVWQLECADDILFSGSFDHTVKRWDPRNWQCTATLTGHKGFVHAMTLGDKELFTGCADRTIKMWS
ncbi:WD40 repeat-like protein [Conidiobolus coronatus NRRL 28638]|uniref:WD40 repeat-like protein n=1 Tax=Conidiobolus coronatus (strain ATCC 28846 / CBS 209.66 / NRRL 28638) TaxID=796925 RepID=A0A137PF14_CONC2|nr:WD40 repeat-like protein [Conidiobolus coronatus NRRL 28638]|eukprot:KXN73562.1 WD40 repeat-like protein [Conidiobolus coronatus NRRL 28638]